MLNNVEKEKFVIDLYYNQRKNVRQIAQEARISFREIAAILKKKEEAAVNDVGNVDGNGNNKNNKYYYYSNEKCTQDYRLFSEGKKPFEVAIELGIREVQVNKFFREFWKLKNLNQLYEIYPQIRCYLPSLLKLHKVLKKKGLTADNVEWFANAIETGVIKLPELQHEYKNLQNKVQTMQYQKQKLERDLQVIQRQIAESTEVENMHQHNVDILQNDIERLYNERSELQQFVSRFNSDRRYLQIKGIAQEVVDRLLAERKLLLNSALIAFVEALRMNPDRYAVIFNSKYDNNNDGNIFENNNSNKSSAISSSHSSAKPSQNYYYNEYHEGILEIANSLLKILTNQIADNTMVAAVKEK
jgi:hypothetical protein